MNIFSYIDKEKNAKRLSKIFLISEFYDLIPHALHYIRQNHQIQPQ